MKEQGRHINISITKPEMNQRICAIIGPSTMTAAEFNAAMQPILQVIDDPNVSLIISDESGCCSLTLRYLAKRKYRNVTIYHLGDENKDMFKNISGLPFKTRGGFTSYIEINEALRQDSDMQIQL